MKTTVEAQTVDVWTKARDRNDCLLPVEVAGGCKEIQSLFQIMTASSA